MSFGNRRLGLSLSSTLPSWSGSSRKPKKKKTLQWNQKDTNSNSVKRLTTWKRGNLQRIVNAEADSLSSDDENEMDMTINALNNSSDAHFFQTSTSGFLAHVPKYVVLVLLK